MQLQVECNRTPGKSEICLVCNTPFVIEEAQIILCSDQGRSWGDVCITCVNQGLNWISERCDRLDHAA